jgi:DNA polymerase I-like protein with 3'-5' exonuclease and polymerase domains
MDNDRFLYYNCLDTTCTFEIRDKFWPEFEASNNQFAYNNTIGIYEPLMFMMTRGINVDFEALEATKRHVVEDRNRAQEELNELAGRPLNPQSPKDCQNYFYIEKGIKPYTNHKTGNITTDDLAMQRIARGTANRVGLREASLVQEIRGFQKLLGTYLEIEFDEDGRMRCSYKPRGTKTGRLSSSATIYGTGTNAQNLPPEFKQFLIPDDGYCFIELDKRQAEWVVVAFLSEDANMLDVYYNDKDPHTHTAHLMFGIDPDVIKREAKLIGNTTDAEYISEVRAEMATELALARFLPRTMSIRQCGKKSNHGLNYDEGYSTFSLLNEIEIPEAKRVIELYHSIYPNIRQRYYKRVEGDLARDRTLTNCFGRKYRFLDAWGHDLFKASYAFLPQSTVVDGLNIGMQSIYNDSSSHMQNIELLSQVHDSILFQIPITDLPKLQQIIKDCDAHTSCDMTYFGRTFKIKTDFKIGMNWGSYHPERNPRGMREFSLEETAAATYKKALEICDGASIK